MNKIIGHANLITFLRNVLKRRSAHAYLLSGPEHIGKTTIVESILEDFFCERPSGGLACQGCLSCRLVARHEHTEIKWLKAAEDKKNITIDDIRSAKEFSQIKPAKSQRFIVIEGAGDLNEPAANALIKVLEEPPVGVVFFLIDHGQTRLLPTILSRCQLIKFGLVSSQLIADSLAGFNLDKDYKNNLLALADGRPGLAYDLAVNQELYNEKINRARDLFKILSDNGWMAGQLILDKELGKGQSIPNSQAAEVLLSVWLEVARDMLLWQNSLASQLRYQELKNELQSLSRLSNRNFAADSLIKPIMSALEQLRQNGQPRLVLENLISSLQD